MEVLRFFIGFEVPGLGLIFLVLNGIADKDADLSAILILIGLSLCVSGFLLGVLTVKCPSCKTRLLWKAVREEPFQTWFVWLITLTSCPTCEIDNR